MIHCRLLIVVFLLALAGCATDYQASENLTLPEPSPADTFVNLGVEYMELGRMDFALKNLQQAIKVDPENSEAHNAIAVLYEQLKQNDLARYHFEKAVDLRPSNARAQNNYGRFLCAQGEYAEAQAHFEKAYNAPLYPHPWLALTNAGTCASLADQNDQAEEYLRQALKLNPRFAPALLEMIELSFKQSNYLSVRAFLQRYLAVSDHTPRTLWIGIQTEQILGDREAVYRYQQLLGANFPESEEAAQMWKQGGQ